MPNETAAPAQAAAPQPSSSLPPAERARLIQCFQHGIQSVAKNPDYAIEMFSACVAGDPANGAYLHALLTALRQKQAGRKAGGLSFLWAAGGRGGLKKLAAAGKYREVIAKGMEIVKANPGDHGSLLVLAEASGRLGFAEAQRVYLRAALDAAPTDVEVNRTCAAFLASYGEYDQAIACWNRIKSAKGMLDEAEKAITQLQVDKTVAKGEKLPGRKPTAVAPSRQPTAVAVPEETPDRRQELERDIAANPAAIEPYLELADLLERETTQEEAEQVLLKALAASGNDLKVREHYEDRQIRWLRNRLHLAEKRLGAEDTPDNRAAVDRVRAALLAQELEIYAARSARYPENVNWKYELAARLKAVGNHAEAIRHFQEVLLDGRRKGAVALELGECFQKIRQYHLAMRNYQTALEALTDREIDLRKRALYRAGVLAAALDDEDAARKHLSTLAELDFGYRDVVKRLDKLAAAKDKGAGTGS